MNGGTSPTRPSGSYAPESAPGGLEAECIRLRQQAKLSWSREFEVLCRAGLQEADDLLELGSGPGDVTALLLDALPRTRITSVDVREDMVAIARRRLEARAAGRITWIVGDCGDVRLPEASFDFAVARYLLQHVADPVAAAREALRLLRPGGRLCVIDVDASMWGCAAPFDVGVAPVYAAASRMQQQDGGDRLIGRRLARILDAAGFAPVRLEVFACDSDETGLDAFDCLLSPDRLLPAVARGVIGTKELDAARAAHARFLASMDAHAIAIGFVGIGEKRRDA